MEIINKPLHLKLHGYSSVAQNNEYVPTAFTLMNKMWETIKSNGIANKGRNIWVYEPNGKMFAGVELESAQAAGLEEKVIDLPRYAWHKHIGPYSLIKQAGQDMRSELSGKGFEAVHPYIEIYGHHDPDESKLETEILMAIK